MNESLKCIKSIIVINTFIHLDSILQSTLLKAKRAFKECSNEEPELPFKFWSSMTESNQTEHFSHEENPITLHGRISIIEGSLESIPLDDCLKNIEASIYAIHSSSNSLTSSVYMNKILNQENSDPKIFNPSVAFPISEGGKSRYYSVTDINACYSFWNSNESQYKEILKNILKFNFSKLWGQKISWCLNTLKVLQDNLLRVFIKNYESKISIQKYSNSDNLSTLSYKWEMGSSHCRHPILVVRECLEIVPLILRVRESCLLEMKKSDEVDELGEKNDKNMFVIKKEAEEFLDLVELYEKNITKKYRETLAKILKQLLIFEFESENEIRILKAIIVSKALSFDFDPKYQNFSTNFSEEDLENLFDEEYKSLLVDIFGIAKETFDDCIQEHFKNN